MRRDKMNFTEEITLTFVKWCKIIIGNETRWEEVRLDEMTISHADEMRQDDLEKVIWEEIYKMARWDNMRLDELN